jgi:hypothetical protein
VSASKTRKTEVTKFSDVLTHNVGKEMMLLRYTATDDTDNFDMGVADEEGPLRVMNDKDFFDLMMYNR